LTWWVCSQSLHTLANAAHQCTRNVQELLAEEGRQGTILVQILEGSLDNEASACSAMLAMNCACGCLLPLSDAWPRARSPGALARRPLTGVVLDAQNVIEGGVSLLANISACSEEHKVRLPPSPACDSRSVALVAP
jgi:hypothetical protein